MQVWCWIGVLFCLYLVTFTTFLPMESSSSSITLCKQLHSVSRVKQCSRGDNLQRIRVVPPTSLNLEARILTAVAAHCDFSQWFFKGSTGLCCLFSFCGLCVHSTCSSEGQLLHLQDASVLPWALPTQPCVGRRGSFITLCFISTFLTTAYFPHSLFISYT